MDLCPATFRSIVVQRWTKIAGCQPQLKPLDTDFDKIAWYRWFWTGICFGTTLWVPTWIFREHFSGVTLLFEHLPSQASKLEHFEILVVHNKINSPNNFSWNFICVFYSYMEEYKHNNCFLKTKQTFSICTK